MIINKITWAISVLALIINSVIPIQYETENLQINDLPQTIYTLEIDMNQENIKVSNALSFDMFYGFEKTSDIATRHKALFAVNGMFYDMYGMPYGIMIKDSKVVTMNSTSTPTILISKDGRVTIEDIRVTGSVIGETNTITLLGTNRAVLDDNWVLFDSIYGTTTRVHRNSINYIIENNTIKDIIITDSPVALHENEYVLTHVTDSTETVFEIGEEISIVFESNATNTNIVEAFQSGGWLVYKGQNVVKDYAAFMGATTAPSPRTLVGITEDNQLIFKVVDGRQPGISIGVTGTQAAQIMIDENCNYAAYLDGGASSTMVVDSKVVNYPSNDGIEREVAHAIIIQLEGN